ncbi:MAG: response regulator transcription factor [Bacteroidales bacterium]|jgi:DNA-binding NarL/FixJ family response regulator|nr:response regulator transcription factor [Bacteroidales bacterium]
MLKVVLVEDHELFRLGVKTALASHPDINIVGEVESGVELFHLLKICTPDLILLDILLPDMSGIEIARRLKNEKPDIKILILSAENSILVIKDLLSIGVNGFITKKLSNIDILADAIRSIINGFEYLGKDISDIIYRVYVSKRKTTEVSKEFTGQERRIIEFCRDGLQSKEIANILKLSPRTIENHKCNIFRKLGINNTVEMIQYAIKNGIIRIDN